MAVEAEIVAARLTHIKTLVDTLELVCLQNGASRDTFQKLKLELEAGAHRGQARPGHPSRTQPSNERRFRRFLESPPPCRLCESRRVTCVGQVEDVGFFRCEDLTRCSRFTSPREQPKSPTMPT